MPLMKSFNFSHFPYPPTKANCKINTIFFLFLQVFAYGILTNFGKKQVLFHFSFGFLGFFS